MPHVFNNSPVEIIQQLWTDSELAVLEALSSGGPVFGLIFTVSLLAAMTLFFLVVGSFALPFELVLARWQLHVGNNDFHEPLILWGALGLFMVPFSFVHGVRLLVWAIW